MNFIFPEILTFQENSVQAGLEEVLMDTNVATQVNREREIKRYTEDIVNSAEAAFPDERMAKIKKRKNKTLKSSQLSNLLAVALDTDSPAAVANWIRYQMGRQETEWAWKSTGLGDDVLDEIKKLAQTAQKIGKDLYGKKVKPEQIMDIHMALIRQYVGYLRRWFVAKGGQ